jgi:hypothetical protein
MFLLLATVALAAVEWPRGLVLLVRATMVATFSATEAALLVLVVAARVQRHPTRPVPTTSSHRRAVQEPRATAMDRPLRCMQVVVAAVKGIVRLVVMPLEALAVAVVVALLPRTALVVYLILVVAVAEHLPTVVLLRRTAVLAQRALSSSDTRWPHNG